MKIIYLIFNELDDQAKTVLDSFSAGGSQGVAEVADYKDPGAVLMSLLGMYEKGSYPGRAFFEGIHSGISLDEDDIICSGILASMDTSGLILKRDIADPNIGELLGRADGLEIEGVRFSVKQVTDNKIILVLKGPGLSEEMVPNDPGVSGVPVPQVIAKDADSKSTASVLNRFVYKTNKIFSKDPLNKGKESPANIILIDGFGRKKEFSSFSKRWGMRPAFVSSSPLVSGLGKFLGMEKKEMASLNELKDFDFLLMDAGKDFKEAAEMIRKAYPEAILAFLLLCPESREIPVLACGNGIFPDRFYSFSLDNCRNGFRLKAGQILRYLLSFLDVL